MAASTRPARLTAASSRDFSGAMGTISSWSSSASWAQTDLDRYIERAAGNAPLFIGERLKKAIPRSKLVKIGRADVAVGQIGPSAVLDVIRDFF
jgi:hypothetical protein